MSAPSPSRPRRLRLVAGAVASVLAVLVGLTAAGPAAGDDLDDRKSALEQQQAAKEQARADAEAALEGLSEQFQQAAQALLDIEQQLPGAQQALADAEAALAGFEREAALIAARLQDAEEQESTIASTIDTDTARADEIRGQIGQMARQAYQGGPGLTSLDLVVGAQTVEEFTEQYGLATAAQRAQEEVMDELATIKANNENAQARLAAVRERITELKAEADAKVAQAEQARQEAADRKAEVERLIAEQTAKKAQLESQKAAAQAEIDKIDAETAAIRSDIEKIAAEQRARAAAAGQAPPAPSGNVSGALFGNPTSINPVYVTSEYGMRLHPILGYYRLHAGIDLRTYCGTPIYAAKDGTVQWAKWRNGFGNQVMVDHGFVNGNSLMTSYNHMTSFVVGAGQAVSRGQLLGYSGNTGTSAACHLHFEVYVNGATVNPRPLLGL
ncbi:metalloendopeptidase [Cellulomonas hominis]|uniref:Metalloendopeptidase n=1 Tax=Cellulomonas hominis TaxID=156981 RepID=A0A511F747_9CELL|nr:M23 family metallopeptidase [Cellulomonas hominis]MBB5474117.1 murein DD-endopeptidase MepM/ murein hydrolase activator NlpD [Cellulomonas hominis]NKY07197.1 peptidoglycan DD-metalloendopeptidase family protein [Cellulomonas hominis]GEL45090.1 metalloendopeptidase [Cellulomonas hominis]